MSDKLHDAVRKALMFEDGAPISDEHRLADDLGADSLDGVEVVMELEETFEVVIPDTFLYGVETVGDLREAVQKAESAKRRGAWR